MANAINLSPNGLLMPSEYQRVEWLAVSWTASGVTGGKYILTDIKPLATDRIFLYMYLRMSTGDYGAGSKTFMIAADSQGRRFGVDSGGSYLQYWFGGTSRAGYRYFPTKNEAGYFGDCSYASSDASVAYAVDEPYAIFAHMETDGSFYTDYMTNKIGISYISISNRSLMYPCYRKSDHTYGFYDCIQKQFYADSNPTTTVNTFEAGADVL